MEPGGLLIRFEERTKLIVIVLLLSVATFATFYFHMVLQVGTIFTQFFYLPLALGALWYRRHSILMVTYLSGLLVVTDIYLWDMRMLSDDVLRTAFFLLVIIVVSYLSDGLARSKRDLMVANGRLESEVDRRTGELQKANAELRQELERRQKAEGLLAAETGRLQVTLSSIGDGVVVTDNEGRAVMMNERAEHLTGRTISEVRGRVVGDVLPSVDATGEMQSPTSRSLADASVHALDGLALIRPDGSRVPLTGTVAPIRMDGETIGAVTVLRDDSVRDRLREQMARANRVRVLELMARGVAHDLNNILTVMSNNLSLVRLRTQGDDLVRNNLDEADRATERARELTDQLRALAKADKPDLKVVSLAPVVKEEVEFHLQGSGVNVTMEMDEGMWSVMADQAQVRRVLSNLVINARQELGSGGELRVRGENMLVPRDDGALAPDRYVRISLQDNGRGIAPEDLDRIFEPYYTTKKKGSGLGLSIAQSIVLGHHGHLLVDSKQGEGTTFSVLLPAAGGSLT